MTKSTKTSDAAVEATVRTDRRNFFKVASGGVVAGGAVVAGGVAADAKSANVEGPTDGYRETDHVRRYYELAR